MIKPNPTILSLQLTTAHHQFNYNIDHSDIECNDIMYLPPIIISIETIIIKYAPLY